MLFDETKTAVCCDANVVELGLVLKVNIGLFLEAFVTERSASTAITDREPST